MTAATIFATATARGRAGVAVIRISGPDAHEICIRLCGGLPPVRRAALRNIQWSGEILDQALVLIFDSGASFTGEPVVEFQIHGGLAVGAAVMRAISETGLARLAEAGEFSRRALENGMLDLTQIEGLADLIDAETEVQRQQATRTMSGEIGRRVETWRQKLIRAAALIEASIDFADEDVPVDVTPEIVGLLTQLAMEMSRELDGYGAAERIRDGFEVAIIGAPNAGKSTLLNRLAGREAAITSEIAGTTRDVIEVRMDINGLAVTFLDTAGLRDSDDIVEQEGIRRAIARAVSADLRVFLGGDIEQIAPKSGDLLVQAKADLGSVGPNLAVSGHTGEGVDLLLQEIFNVLSQRIGGAGILIRERHRDALMLGMQHVSQAVEQIQQDVPLELVSESLRTSVRSLDILVGRVDVEDLLGEIFSSFCIGK